MYKNLLEPCGLTDVAFLPYGSTKSSDLTVRYKTPATTMRYPHNKTENFVLFYDQEPLFKSHSAHTFDRHFFNIFKCGKSFNVLATSEHSQEKRNIITENMLYDWYYFFHGFASLDWYKIYRHMPNVEKPFTKVFISLNHLMTKDRSYRLNLVSSLMEQDLIQYGLVSLQLEDKYGSWKDELFSSDSNLSVDSKKRIFKQLHTLTSPLVVDTHAPSGTLSAEADIELQQQALWNIVSETVFYHDKLHLTEKIFKPIVSRRPFILVGAPNNLAYLKSYGFKTFDRWIDESYDSETDSDIRIQKITEEIAKLCALTPDELNTMHKEMEEVLEHNFMHFYTDFKTQIVHELVDNFEGCLNQYNCGKIGDKRIKPDINFSEVKKRMLL